MSPDLVVVDIGDVVPSPTSDSCEATLRTAIDRTRQMLLTGRRELRNRLTSDITAGAGSLVLDFPIGGIQAGTVLAIDLELFYVWNVTGQTITVEPAQAGTVAANHDAGSMVWVNSRQSDWDILNAINDTLKDLSSPETGLFAIGSIELAYNATLRTYDLTDVENLEDILDVYYPTAAPETQQWVRVNEKYWRLQRDADTAVFPSGLALQFFKHFGTNDGSAIRIVYKTRYSPMAAYTDNIEATTFLHCDAHDLLWLGATIRLSDTREIERNQTKSQGDPRRAGEVPAGAQNAAPANVFREYRRRCAAEASRLSRRWPTHYR